MAKRKLRRNPTTDMISSEAAFDAARRATSLAEESGEQVALAGGVAMHFYGSPRLTADVDMVGSGEFPGLGRPRGTLTIGGRQHKLDGVEIDLILRDDDYRELYEEALAHAVDSDDGFAVVSPEYLAAMKLAARSDREKHEGDLVWLLMNVAVDLDATREIVRRLVGGQFAVDEFDAIVEEAEWRKSRKGD